MSIEKVFLNADRGASFTQILIVLVKATNIGLADKSPLLPANKMN